MVYCYAHHEERRHRGSTDKVQLVDARQTLEVADNPFRTWLRLVRTAARESWPSHG